MKLLNIRKTINEVNIEQNAKRYIPTNARNVKINPDIDQKFYTVYTYESDKSPTHKFILLVFKGKQAKPMSYISFKNAKERDNYFEAYILPTINQNVQYKSDLKNIKQPFKVGDILVSTWGYEQTNVDFYKVLSVNNLTVTFQELQSQQKSDGDMQGTAVPTQKLIGAVRKGQMRNRGNATYIKLNSYSFAHLWDGKPERYTAYH